MTRTNYLRSLKNQRRHLLDTRQHSPLFRALCFIPLCQMCRCHLIRTLRRFARRTAMMLPSTSIGLSTISCIVVGPCTLHSTPSQLLSHSLSLTTSTLRTHLHRRTEHCT